MTRRQKCQILVMAGIMMIIIFVMNFYFVGVISHQPYSSTTQLPPEQHLQDVMAEIKYALTPRRHIDLKTTWDMTKSWVSQEGLYSIKNHNMLGNVMNSMRTAKVLRAENAKKGTQLKLLFTLDGKQDVFFKPKWYVRDHIINGSIYSGKDRHNAEVVAFYLSLLLDMRWVPIAVLRNVHVKRDIVDVGSSLLKETVSEKESNLCFYGKCFYCRRNETICSDDDGLIEGAVILLIDEKLTKYNSLWQRTYKTHKKAEWETKPNYCSTIKSNTRLTRLLDFIDTAIFDFLLQNGDRHHYETVMDRIVLLDNGKSLGNPRRDVVDILAPLYQCCIIRKKTWDRLQLFSGGSLSASLKELLNFEPGDDLLTPSHLEAMDRRLGMIYETVEKCISKHGKTIFRHR